MTFGKPTARKALLRRIALLESALWRVRIYWPDDRTAQESILSTIEGLRCRLEA